MNNPFCSFDLLDFFTDILVTGRRLPRRDVLQRRKHLISWKSHAFLLKKRPRVNYFST